MLNTTIISAFPGVGKTFFHKKYSNLALDSDSSLFNWIEKDGARIRNIAFPGNYWTHIKQNVGQYKYIFISTHIQIRDVLVGNKIPFYLIYPTLDQKEDYLQRYERRGSSEAFINTLDENWNNWLFELDRYAYNNREFVTAKVLLKGQTLTDLLIQEDK